MHLLNTQNLYSAIMSKRRKESRNRQAETMLEPAAHGLLTRRKLLIAGGIGGLATLIGGGIYALLRESPDQEKVCRFVEQFPTSELPGKPVTRSVPHKGATHCLVNFETMHSHPMVELDALSKQIVIQAQQEKLNKLTNRVKRRLP